MTRHAIVTADRLDVHCAVCAHEWVLPLQRPLPIDRFILVTRGFIEDGCPACGAHGPNVICGRRCGIEQQTRSGRRQWPCKDLGHPQTEPHKCPYAFVIHDNDKPCTCCENCEEQCWNKT